MVGTGMTTGQDDLESASIDSGAVVRRLREVLHRDRHDRPVYTQEALYLACQAIESADQSVAGKRRFGPVNTEKYRARKISAIETSKRRIEVYEARVIARAFKLPENFLLATFGKIEEIDRAYEIAKSSAHPLGIPAKSELGVTPSHGGTHFRRIDKDDPIPQSRQALSKELTKTLMEAPRHGSAIVVLEGKSAVGKSYFLGHWYRDEGLENFPGAAICLDCASITLDQIVPQLYSMMGLFHAADSSPLDLAGHLATLHRNLIVLDGLRLRRDPNGSALLIAGDGRMYRVSELMGVLHPILRDSGNTCCVVCLENNNSSVELEPFIRHLPSSIATRKLNVFPLQPGEGAQFLRDLGVAQLSHAELAEIAGELHGMPLALRVAANELCQAPQVVRERYLETIKSGIPKTDDAAEVNEFQRAFVRYRERVEKEHAISSAVGAMRRGVPATATAPHPVALLRLLGLMPEPIHYSQLTYMLEPNKIARLAHASIETVEQANIPFVKLTNSTVDLHAMARGMMRHELDGFIASDQFEKCTSRLELEWIHWRASLWHWRILKDETDIDALTMSNVSDFVFHIVEQIRTLKRDDKQRRQKNYSRGITKDMIVQFERSAHSLTDIQLWLIAYHRVVRPLLLDPKHIPTRVFGQFEAKARTLETLAEPIEAGTPFQPLEMADLYKETALCWMHSGRLQSAFTAINKSINSCQLALRDKGLPASLEEHARALSVASNGLDRDIWRIGCDIVSARSIIRLRLGRPLDEIEDALAPYVEKIESLITLADQVGQEPKSHPPPFERGAVRIMARKADLAMHSGDYETALFWFNRADKLQHRIRGRGLDGEAARRLVHLLVRTRHEAAGNLERARHLITDNVNRAENYKRRFGRVSNDVVPFLILGAALQRVAGNLDEAERQIDEVGAYDHMRRRECTFMTSADYTLERARIRIAQRKDLDTQLARIQRLARRAEDTHHFVLKHECDLIAAEIDHGRREHIVSACTIFFRGTANRDRMRDVLLLRNGSSPIAELGV